MFKPSRQEEKNKKIELALLALIVCVCFFLVTLCVVAANSQEPEEDDVALWLARSCVGEANFDSVETGECAAIMHIYLKRTQVSGMPLLKVIKKYSAATKDRKDHPRKWVLHMDRSLRKPDYWPSRKKKWSSVESLWEDAIIHAEEFLDGHILDPVPDADHYGNDNDADRAISLGWIEIPTEFKNRFFALKK